MIATQNQQTSKDSLPPGLTPDKVPATLSSGLSERPFALDKASAIHSPSSMLLPGRILAHHPQAGLNPLVDTAGHLFSALGKLKQINSYRHLSKLQHELIQEITHFYDAAKNHGYNAEYLVVCRYIICATFDDIISDTSWGGQGQWDCHSLLTALNQDTHHHDKFFTILERAIHEPILYIDLMELIYICLSLGYKGQYRLTEHSHYQLEQITNNLYKHIRAFRGSMNKTLSPPPPKAPQRAVKKIHRYPSSLLVTFFVTACILMTIFISLGYLMDIISNEAYKNIAQIEPTISNQNIG